jgi:enoyl-CoA hydratase/carnithine racemase
MVTVGQLSGQPDLLELDLDAHGDPQRPVLLIDTDQARERLSYPELIRAADRVRCAAPLTVAVTRGDQPLDPIAEAADISLARGDKSRPHRHLATVACMDPWAEAAEIATRVAERPRAALTLTWLLRAGRCLEAGDALVSESAAYSMLLGSAEFTSWLALRGPARAAGPTDRVRVRRDGDELTISLARPARRNAVDARMRDALAEALALAEIDQSLQVVLTGDGPSFSAGGDLDEFGTAADPATAHLVRVTASPAAILHRIRDRVTARVHGVCVGAGIELPAFAGRLIAGPDTEFGLPEIAMGLIPGAGGTVSIPRRIGRARTLWFATSGRRLDAQTALDWGLIDAIDLHAEPESTP